MIASAQQAAPSFINPYLQAGSPPLEELVGSGDVAPIWRVLYVCMCMLLARNDLVRRKTSFCYCTPHKPATACTMRVPVLGMVEQ